MWKFIAIACGVVPLCLVPGTHAEQADTAILLQTFSVGQTASTLTAAAGAVDAVGKSIVNVTCSCLSVEARCGLHQVCAPCVRTACQCLQNMISCAQVYECCSGEQTEKIIDLGRWTNISKRTRGTRRTFKKCIKGKIKAGIQDRLKSAHDDESHAIKKEEWVIQMLNDSFNEQEAEWNHEKKLHEAEKSKWQVMRDSHTEINKRQTDRQTKWETWQASRGMGAAVRRVLFNLQGKPVRERDPRERDPVLPGYDWDLAGSNPCGCDDTPCWIPPPCHVCRPFRCAPCAPQQPCAMSENPNCKAEFEAVQHAIKAYNL